MAELTPRNLFDAGLLRLAGAGRRRHIVDDLIEERAVRLSRHPAWPLLRPLLHGLLGYDEAVRLADAVSPLPGSAVFDSLAARLRLHLDITGASNIPAHGGFILACSHPTGLADPVAAWQLLAPHRSDITLFGNRDALRVAPRLADLVIPVEWRATEKTRAKSRVAAEATARAFAAGRAVILFPSGRIAFWNVDRIDERPWQTSLVSLARRYEVPVVPVSMQACNSRLFHLFARTNTELRDMTVFRELLNKRGSTFRIVVGKPVAADALAGDPAEVTRALQRHTVEALERDPDATFAGA
ncbi:MAG: 1-acyl-sn-glycerol-3-phosphate acyltransferase [Rhizobiaceae bacterium]|nr:1-acyl-sn-glycerol-3-phosphate acyltransferase [Rhizobiaceae bacterium]